MEIPEAISLLWAIRKWKIEKRYVSNNPARPEANWKYAITAVIGVIVLVIGLVLERRGHEGEVEILDAERNRVTKELGDAKVSVSSNEARVAIFSTKLIELA